MIPTSLAVAAIRFLRSNLELNAAHNWNFGLAAEEPSGIRVIAGSFAGALRLPNLTLSEPSAANRPSKVHDKSCPKSLQCVEGPIDGAGGCGLRQPPRRRTRRS